MKNRLVRLHEKRGWEHLSREGWVALPRWAALGLLGSNAVLGAELAALPCFKFGPVEPLLKKAA